MVEQENNKNNLDENQSISNKGWSDPKIKVLKWAVIMMSVILVLGFGLVLYKMTEIIISMSTKSETRQLVKLNDDQSKILNINIDGRKVRNVSLHGSKIAIHLEEEGNSEIWIYDRSKNKIIEKIILKK